MKANSFPSGEKLTRLSISLSSFFGVPPKNGYLVQIVHRRVNRASGVVNKILVRRDADSAEMHFGFRNNLDVAIGSDLPHPQTLHAVLFGNMDDITSVRRDGPGRGGARAGEPHDPAILERQARSVGCRYTPRTHTQVDRNPRNHQQRRNYREQRSLRFRRYVSLLLLTFAAESLRCAPMNGV